MGQVDYGFPFPLPLASDFVNYSNEDIGFNASLVAATNDVFAFALPYPATLNLFDETIVVYAIELMVLNTGRMHHGVTMLALEAWFAMLDREFGATWFGDLSDAEDEAFKAQFGGPVYFGEAKTNITATVAAEGSYREGDTNIIAMYYPPVPLDLITPLFIQFVNASGTATLATNVVANANFTVFERTALRVWFTKRMLTSSEKATRNMAIRFQRLDS